jgi:hypothetical protein
VKSFVGREPRILKSVLDTNGYLVVNLTKDGVRHLTRVHDAVLLTFIGPKREGQECRHLARKSKTNNNVLNLAWGDRQDQEEDKDKHGTRQHGEDYCNAKLNDDYVRAIRRRARAGGLTKRALCRMYSKITGAHPRTILKVINGEKWKHVGAENEEQVAAPPARVKGHSMKKEILLPLIVGGGPPVYRYRLPSFGPSGVGV